MGRRKIEIAAISDDRNRSVTFTKRKQGLMKKAYELGVLCNAEVALIIFSQHGKAYEFSSNGHIDGTLYRYSHMQEEPAESKGPADFGSLGVSAALGHRAGDDDEDEEEPADDQAKAPSSNSGSADERATGGKRRRKSASSSRKASRPSDAMTTGQEVYDHTMTNNSPATSAAPHFWPTLPAPPILGSMASNYPQIPAGFLQQQIAQLSRAGYPPILPAFETIQQQALASIQHLPYYANMAAHISPLGGYPAPASSAPSARMQRSNSDQFDRSTTSAPPVSEGAGGDLNGSMSESRPLQRSTSVDPAEAFDAPPPTTATGADTFEDYLTAAGYHLDGQTPRGEQFKWPSVPYSVLDESADSPKRAAEETLPPSQEPSRKKLKANNNS